MESPAPTGKVTTQETIILPTTEKSTAESPLAKPTPSTAPTRVCVVEIGLSLIHISEPTRPY